MRSPSTFLMCLLLGCGCGGDATTASPDDGGDRPADIANHADADADAPTPAEELDPGTGPQPTRLRITSRCAQPIWIARSDNGTGPQNARLDPGAFQDYEIPDRGLASVRYWPKIGCDAEGHGCQVGDNGEGGGKPCPATGCQPPLDSKFEATFAAVGAAEATWYNLSLVDGYSLPFAVIPKGTGAGVDSCQPSDCSGLVLSECPASEDMSGGGAYPAYANMDLRVRDAAATVIACLAPCKKWNYPAPYGLGRDEAEEPGLHMCCPTPIDPATGQCTPASGCLGPTECRNLADPVSVEHTAYVDTVRRLCRGAYGYSYDDEVGLHNCPSDTSFEVVFCPQGA